MGSGFAGLGMAIQLRRRGEHDFVVLERARAVGGVWRDNTYPGCACDVQSVLYSYSFAPNPDWSRRYAPQAEILDYLLRVARDEGVLPHVRLGREVTRAAWDEGALRWRIETRDEAGRVEVEEADALVLAAGALSDPVYPRVPGLERFEGPAFHSAHWDHAAALRGRRVVVVGSGASAAQFVPAIQPRVGTLTLLQRTPPWVLPRRDRARPAWVRRLARRVPATQAAVRRALYVGRELLVAGFRWRAFGRVAEWEALRHLRRQVRDPALRARLTPRYHIGCKRVVVSDDWYPALQAPNVTVADAGLAEVRARSVVGTDGVERPADVLVFATGFRPTSSPLAPLVYGRGGRALADAWGGSPRAYAGTTVPGFPNLFVVPGPNTGLGHTSVLVMIEAQLAHALACLDHLRASGAAALEPRAEAEAAWTRAVDARMRATAWVAGGCTSWYLDATGRNSTLWPDVTWRFRRLVARVRPADYALLGAAAGVPNAPGVALPAADAVARGAARA